MSTEAEIHEVPSPVCSLCSSEIDLAHFHVYSLCNAKIELLHLSCYDDGEAHFVWPPCNVDHYEAYRGFLSMLQERVAQLPDSESTLIHALHIGERGTTF